MATTHQAGASGEDVTLSYFTFSAAPDHLEDLDTIVAAFEAENPNINVEVQTAAFADYFTSLQTQLAGGSAPDTFELNYENFVTYARSGALLDLSESWATAASIRPATTRWPWRPSPTAAPSTGYRRRSPTSC